MGRFINRLRRPTADNTANEFMNQVVGNKADAAAAGVVTETDTLTAYIKQIVTHVLAEADVEAKIDVIDEFHDVPAQNNVLNDQINEVIGNKTDAGAADAVTNTDTLVGYIKQLVTAAIANAAAMVIVDEFHDVPAKDNVLNAQINEVLGNKEDTTAADAVTETDTIVGYIKQLVAGGIARDAVIGNVTTAAAADAVTDTDLLMAYIKQLVTLAIARDTAIGTIDDLHDVPTKDAATNLYIRDVVGIKTDSAADGAVSDVESIMAYVKQAVTEGIARDAVIGALNTAAAEGAVTNADLMMAYIKQLVTAIVDGVILGADAITAAKVGDDAFSEEHFDGDAVQAMTMGKKVSKATVVLGTGTTNLFTVATGRVVVHAIVGEVTIMVQGQATGCKLISTPTVGTAVDLCVALDLTGDEAGCLYGITGLFSDALVGSNAGATVSLRNPIIVPVGVIGVSNGGGANTGSVKWDIYYTPLDTGAVITAA